MGTSLLLGVLPASALAAADNVLVRPWGDNALRIQVAPADWTLTDSLATAYLPGGAPHGGHFSFGPTLADVTAGPVTSGNIRATLGSDGLLSVSRVSDGAVLLKEASRAFKTDGSPSSVTWDFSASASRLFGMGQNRLVNNGGGLPVDVVNQSYDFAHSVGEEGGPSNSLPWVMGAEPTKGGFQWGLLFNSPAMGGAVFDNAKGGMQWSIVGDAGGQKVRKQFDFLVTTHAADAKPAERPFQIIEKYVDAVGHARKMPYPGYWHSKNRYASQDELLEVARGFHNRSIPVEVIVIDWYHWKVMGDWSFDSAAWPDPKAMVEECASYGMEIMVSVWPFSCPNSRSYDTLMKNNWVTTYVGADGKRTNIPIETYATNCRLIDPTVAAAREYIFSLVVSGYYQYGIKIFWLDASEPAGFGPTQLLNASWAAGTMRDQGSMFQLYWTQAIYDGLRSKGEEDIMMLPRAGWVGTWRHGAALWSGDIGGTMPVLKSQVNIGLSAQTSGIPWWTTDIGGYNYEPSRKHAAETAAYREIIVRWFQYGLTCPLFRQHGARDYTAIWAYGAEDERIIGDLIKLRASLRPYLVKQLDALNETGRPFNRPLTWDFPEDPMTWELAEAGIGGNKTHKVMSGDWVVTASCESEEAADQTWKLSGGHLGLVAGSGSGMCLDRGGTAGGKPPSGPWEVHMWGCSGRESAAQTWGYSQNTLTNGKECLTTSPSSTHPTVTPCTPGDANQRWEFNAGAAAGSQIKSASGQCLTVVAAPDPVADQYMVGDELMAAPILAYGQRSRKVYFPKGATWRHHFTNTTYQGGSVASVEAPLDVAFPLFWRE